MYLNNGKVAWPHQLNSAVGQLQLSYPSHAVLRADRIFCSQTVQNLVSQTVRSLDHDHALILKSFLNLPPQNSSFFCLKRQKKGRKIVLPMM